MIITILKRTFAFPVRKYSQENQFEKRFGVKIYNTAFTANILFDVANIYNKK